MTVIEFGIIRYKDVMRTIDYCGLFIVHRKLSVDMVAINFCICNDLTCYKVIEDAFTYKDAHDKLTILLATKNQMLHFRYRFKLWHRKMMFELLSPINFV